MKKENKSLFLYTSLIFIVSILMILIAFAGQNHIRKVQPETDASGNSLTNKVNTLSEQNAKLTNENAALNQKIMELENTNTANQQIIDDYLNQINSLTNSVETLTHDNNILNSFIKIETLLDEKNYREARNIYNSIDPTHLNEEQKIYYDKITLIIK